MSGTKAVRYSPVLRVNVIQSSTMVVSDGAHHDQAGRITSTEHQEALTDISDNDTPPRSSPIEKRTTVETG